jgi:NAD-dependent SIR2 family protein deacetylase
MTIDVIKFAKTVTSAEAILIGAGAGMGVDSGLPDFRGKKGFGMPTRRLHKLA